MRGPAASRVVALALTLVVASIALSGIWHAAAVPDAQAAPTPSAAPASPTPAAAVTAPTAAPAALAPIDPPGYIRLARPTALPANGPRKVAIQAGHWLTQDAPAELWRVVTQTGTSWNGVREVDVNLDIAQRVADLLTARGVEVEVLPTTVPPGYLADAFVALHADGDGVGVKSGFKSAHSARRTPFEERLEQLVDEEFGVATELPFDDQGISRAMIGYYAMAWSRIRYSTSPFTPSMILEMGYLSNDWDRHLLVDEPDRLAAAIATGILRFLDENPRATLFGQDLVLAPQPRPQGPFGPPPPPSAPPASRGSAGGRPS